MFTSFENLCIDNFTDDVSARCVGKIADFGCLTLCISLKSNQMCIYFCKDFIVFKLHSHTSLAISLSVSGFFLKGRVYAEFERRIQLFL